MSDTKFQRPNGTLLSHRCQGKGFVDSATKAKKPNVFADRLILMTGEISAVKDRYNLQEELR